MCGLSDKFAETIEIFGEDVNNIQRDGQGQFKCSIGVKQHTCASPFTFNLIYTSIGNYFIHALFKQLTTLIVNLITFSERTKLRATLPQ